MGVHLSGKHAPELKLFDFPLGIGQLLGNVGQGIVVTFGLRQQLQFRGLFQRPADAVKRVQFGLKAGLFLAQRLGPLRIVPNTRIFQRTLDLREALPLGLVVKDTP